MQNMNEQSEMENRIKVGYILPDLKVRRTAFVSYALLEHADTKRLEVFCYAQGGAEFLKERCAAKPLQWRELSDSLEFAAQVVERDRLDYLVDLSEHSTKQAQAILARRSAPVQMSTLGYFNTTGIENVDYLLSDRICTPEASDHRYFKEKVIYIPQTFMAYTPLLEREPYTEAPLKRNEYVTFGCLHHFSRLTDEFLMVWQKILARLPRAHLALKSRIFSNAYGCEETRYRFKRLGFDKNRIAFYSNKKRDIDLYREIDIILDTVPYQGAMTTCDALYMGVPVIAFAGKKHSMRMGCSILHQTGMADCVAYDVPSYIEKAVALAENPYKLSNLHKNLRASIKAAPLMDGARYARNVENIYHFLRESAESRRKEARMLAEVCASLYAAEEKLALLHGRLVAGDVLQRTLHIFDEVLYTFRNVKFAVMKLPDMDFALLDALISRGADARRKADAGNVIKACEEISTQLMPRLKQLVVSLEARKVLVLN